MLPSPHGLSLPLSFKKPAKREEYFNYELKLLFPKMFPSKRNTTFHQPKLVSSRVDKLKTLRQRVNALSKQGDGAPLVMTHLGRQTRVKFAHERERIQMLGQHFESWILRLQSEETYKFRFLPRSSIEAVESALPEEALLSGKKPYSSKRSPKQ